MFQNHVTTWVSNSYLDNIYEELRQAHYNIDHKLRENYSVAHIQEVSAKSIYWDHLGNPSIVCSILNRSCWPTNTYRILNRLWKTKINSGKTFNIDNGFYLLLKNQMNWCYNHDASAIFMSRQTSGKWQQWVISHFLKISNINLHAPTEYFLTCDNEECSSCWQKIIFHGDTRLLNNWKKKTIL